MPSRPPDQPAANDGWQPAGASDVVRLAHHLRGRKSRRQFLKAGGGACAGVLAAAGGWWVIRSTSTAREYDFGGITCSEVAERVPDLMQGRLPADELAQLKRHVQLCPICKAKLEQMDGMKLLG